MALITQDVHFRDIVQDLYESGVTGLQSFKWHS